MFRSVHMDGMRVVFSSLGEDGTRGKHPSGEVKGKDKRGSQWASDFGWFAVS